MSWKSSGSGTAALGGHHRDGQGRRRPTHQGQTGGSTLDYDLPAGLRWPGRERLASVRLTASEAFTVW